MPVALYRIAAAPILSKKQDDDSVTTAPEADFGRQFFVVAGGSSEALKKAAAHFKGEFPNGNFAGMEVFNMEVVISEFSNDGTVILR